MSIGTRAIAKTASIAVPATTDRGTAATMATTMRETVSRSQAGFLRQSNPPSVPIAVSRISARAGYGV